MIKNPPTSYLKKLYFDTVVFSYEQLKYLVDTFSSDNIIMGTDYPYDMAEDNPVQHVIETVGLTDEDKRKITGGNIAKLLKISI